MRTRDMTLRTTIMLGVALSAAFFSTSAQAQEIFQPGTAPVSDLLAPPSSSVIQSSATPLLGATAFTSRNTISGGDIGYTVLSAEDAALLAAQAVGQPVTVGGVAQTAATAPTGLTAFPTAAPQPLLTTPAGVDTGLTAVAIMNGVPVTAGPVTNIRGGYGNGTGALATTSFGGSVLVSYGSDLPIVGPDYAGQLPGSGLSQPAPIPYVGADRADAVAAAARSGLDSVANSGALSGNYGLATNYAGPIPNIRISAPAYKKLANQVASAGTTRSTAVIDPFKEQSGTADAAGTNVASPVNESKDAVQSFSRITENEATAGATTPEVATNTSGASASGTTFVSGNRTLASSGSDAASATAAASGSGTTFVSSQRTLSGSATTDTATATAPASNAGGCTSQGITLQFEGDSNRFTGSQTAQVKEFGELCAAAKQKVMIIGYADSNIANENDALRTVKGRVLRALHALTDAGLDDSMVTRETLVPTGNQPSNALIVRAN